MKKLLSASCFLVAALLAPSIASAQIGCEVVRQGSITDTTLSVGGGEHFQWPNLVSNACSWPDNGTDLSHSIEIRVPVGAGRCYDGEILVTIENRTDLKAIAVSSHIQRLAPRLPDGWATPHVVATRLAPRGAAGSSAAVHLEIPIRFQSADDDQLSVKGFLHVERIDGGGAANIRITATEFQVWEVDCDENFRSRGPR